MRIRLATLRRSVAWHDALQASLTESKSFVSRREGAIVAQSHLRPRLNDVEPRRRRPLLRCPGPSRANAPLPRRCGRSNAAARRGTSRPRPVSRCGNRAGDAPAPRPESYHTVPLRQSPPGPRRWNRSGRSRLCRKCPTLLLGIGEDFRLAGRSCGRRSRALGRDNCRPASRPCPARPRQKFRRAARSADWRCGSRRHNRPARLPESARPFAGSRAERRERGATGRRGRSTSTPRRGGWRARFVPTARTAIRPRCQCSCSARLQFRRRRRVAAPSRAPGQRLGGILSARPRSALRTRRAAGGCARRPARARRRRKAGRSTSANESSPASRPRRPFRLFDLPPTMSGVNSSWPITQRVRRGDAESREPQREPSALLPLDSRPRSPFHLAFLIFDVAARRDAQATAFCPPSPLSR